MNLGSLTVTFLFTDMSRSTQDDLLVKHVGAFKPLNRVVKRGGRVQAMNALAQVEGRGMLLINKGGEEARVWCRGQRADNRMEFLVVEGEEGKPELYSVNADVAADAVVTDVNMYPEGLEQSAVERQIISDFILGALEVPKLAKRKEYRLTSNLMTNL